VSCHEGVGLEAEGDAGVTVRADEQMRELSIDKIGFRFPGRKLLLK